MKNIKTMNIVSGSLLLLMIAMSTAAFPQENQSVKSAYERYIKSYTEFKNAVARDSGEEQLKIYADRYSKDLEAYRKLITDKPESENSDKAVEAPAATDGSEDSAAESENQPDIQNIILELRSAETQDGKNAAIAKLESVLASGNPGAAIGEARLALGEAYMTKKEYSKAAALFDILIKSQGSSNADLLKKASSLKKRCELNNAVSSAYAALILANNKYDGISWTNTFAKIAAKLACTKASAEYNFARARLAASSLFEKASGGSNDSEPVLNSGCAPLITGAFFQFSGGHNDEKDYPLEYWEKELSAMKKIGMDTAIVQFNQSDGTDLSPATERFLTAADSLDMKVFVGTMLNESTMWYVGAKFNPIWLAKESKIVAEYTTQLVRQFKDHKSFVGVYIPYEDNTLSLPGALGDFYAAIVKAAKAEKPELLSLISPFTCIQPGRAKSLPGAVLKKYYKTMLSRSKIDICAWQDGVGGTTDQLKKVDEDLGAIASACNEIGITVWSNAEVFHRTTPLSEGFSAEGTAFQTMKSQIDAEYKYVSKIICFDFNHYFSPNIESESAKKLYNDYLWYYQNRQRAK